MFRILVVCTANICRSPATAALLRNELQKLVANGVIHVDSAGVSATANMPACGLSGRLMNESVARRHTGSADPRSSLARHRSRRVTPALAQRADLVLTLERAHRAELARMAATARPKTFTLRQAANLSRVVRSFVAAQEIPVGAPPLPADSVSRLRWWAAELDAARGSAPRHMNLAEADPAGLMVSWHPG
ncbi:MAG: hypothetical protein V9E98_00225 [Candidatus Nanopelagicales bacterium]